MSTVTSTDEALSAVKRPRLATLLLVVSFGLVGAGLVLPAITVSSMWVYEREYSILGGIMGFFEDGNVALGLLLLTLSVIFPMGKILFALVMSRLVGRNGPAATRLLGVLSSLSRWSMADVFVLALIVLVVNGQLLSAADIHLGAGLFAGGVLLSAFATARVHKLAANALAR